MEITMNSERTPHDSMSCTPSPYYAIATAISYREDLHGAIAEAAYFHAERRGFTPGHELEDWLAGEAEVEESILRKSRNL